MKKLTSAQDAIKQAIEGGYPDFVNAGYQGEPEKWIIAHIDGTEHLIIEFPTLPNRGKKTTLKTVNDILLDPLFWIALGKARGWGQKIYKTDTGEEWGKRICLHCGIDCDIQPPIESGCNHVHYPEACKVCSDKATKWRDVAIRWFETRLSDGDEEKFWQSLP